MKRSRLSEAQFTAIASGYLALMSATEVEKFVRENAAALFKDWTPKTTSMSRNTINRVFSKLDERISLLVEDGLLNDFPYSAKNITDPVEKEALINNVISSIYLLLTDQMSTESLKQVHDTWRAQGHGFLFDSTIWYGTKIMWNKLHGLDRQGLRRLFNRVALVAFFMDDYKETSAIQASNATLGFLLNYLRAYPLE